MVWYGMVWYGMVWYVNICTYIYACMQTYIHNYIHTHIRCMQIF